MKAARENHEDKTSLSIIGSVYKSWRPHQKTDLFNKHFQQAAGFFKKWKKIYIFHIQMQMGLWREG